MSSELTHFDEKGHARMVDVSGKPDTQRTATAACRVILGETAFTLLMDNKLPKGDALAVARVAGIMAAKRVDTLIPLCHSLPLHDVMIDFQADDDSHAVDISATVKTKGPTGAEMEALTAVSVAALAIYDMCKAVEKGICIDRVRLEYKSGGKSGIWTK